MDDSVYRIPDQPNQPQNQDTPNRPDGADSAADIARAKLRAIYDQQSSATPQSQQSQPDASVQPHALPDPAQFQPEPIQSVQPQRPQDLQLPAQPEPQVHDYNQPEHQPVNEPEMHQPKPTIEHSYEPQQQFAQTKDQALPQQQQTFQPDVEPQQVAVEQFTQPETQTAPPPEQPQIIQPTPQRPVTPETNALDFHIPGQPSQPAIQTPNPQPNNYVPAQQYSQEISLEDQIDGLKHTAPDHQLPIQSQASVKKSWIPSNLQPFLRTLALAAVIAIIYNHQFLVGQVQSYINPAQSVVSPTIIAPNQSDNISDDNKILIPKINVDVPVVYDITTFEESAVQAGLERGVVHYGNTPLPGENGNNVIVGHSSNNFWNNGQYKFAFVLLNKLQEGDTFTLHYEGTSYTYEVFRKQIVPPTAVDVIFEDFGEPVTTLITCDPPGTSWNRLIVNARQISPNPDQATTPQSSDRPDEVITVPSDSTSLLDNLFN